MSDSNDRIVWRRRVSLAGHVMRADGSAAGGGSVRLQAAARNTAKARDAAPPHAAAPAIVAESPVRRDGLYFFLDVPAGDYAVTGHDERGHATDVRRVTLAAADRARRPPLLDIDLVVAPAPGAGARRPP